MAEQAKKIRAASGHGLEDQAPADRHRQRNRVAYKPRQTSFAEKVLRAGSGGSTLGKAYGLDPVTTDRDYEADELEFMLAMDEYRRTKRRPFPTWCEALVILKSLGYRKVDAP